MNTTKHVINTWLVALLWFPFFSCGFTILMTNETNAFELMPLLLGFGFLFSLPALLLCCLGIRLLYALAAPYEFRFILWLLVVAVSILASAVVICLLLFDLQFLFEMMPFILAAVVAAATSVMLRFRQFIYFIHKKTKEYENNLV